MASFGLQTFTDAANFAVTAVQTWGDYSTKVIDYDYLPHARLRLRINKITI